MKEVLNTDRGTRFYVVTKVKVENGENTQRSIQSQQQQQQQQQPDSEDANNDDGQSNADLLSMDEVIPNTKPAFLTELQEQSYLADGFIGLDVYADIRNV